MAVTDGAEQEHVESCPVPLSWEWGAGETPDGKLWKILTIYTPTGHQDYYFTDEAVLLLGMQAQAAGQTPIGTKLIVPDLAGVPDVTKLTPR